VQKSFIEDTELTQWDLMMWRPVFSDKCKVSSFTEIRDNWTLSELLDCCEMLDFYEDLEEEYSKQK
jgi:hypothetical protein